MECYTIKKLSKRKIFLCETDKSLFLFLLITESLSGRNIYVGNKYTTNIDVFNRLIGLKVLLDNKYKGKKGRLFKSIQKRFGYILFRKLICRLKNREIELFGLYHTFLANYIFSEVPLNLIEDGLGLVLDFDSEKMCKRNKVKYKIFLKLNRYLRKNRTWWINNFGIDPNIKNFYFTPYLYNFFKNNINNINLVEIKKMWDKKSTVEKQYILDVFGVSTDIINELNQCSKKVWILTQPLSEDGIISEEEKIDLYKIIIKKYSGNNIIIKPHPRETTNYAKVFPESLVINNEFLMEILFCIGVAPLKVVTLFSSAVCQFEGIYEIDFYGTEINKKIFNRFGSLDRIMKRNVQL